MSCRKISLGVLSSWTWYNHEEIGQEGERGRQLSIWRAMGYGQESSQGELTKEGYGLPMATDPPHDFAGAAVTKDHKLASPGLKV